MLASAISSAQAKPEKKPWTKEQAAVYEAYVTVNGMPPTDLVMEHYMYVLQNSKLKNKAALEARMKKDLPSEVE